MKTRILFNIILSAAVFLMAGCDGNNGNGPEPSPGGNAPVIAELQPRTGQPDDLIEISGFDFGTAAEEVTVNFGKEEAEVVSVEDRKITFRVPAPPDGLAVLKVDVSVTVGDNESNKSGFTYLAPKITEYGYHVGFPGEDLVINGKGFGRNAAANKVTFGTIEADVIEAAAERLVVRVPSGSGKVPVKVALADYPVLNSGDTDFTYDADATALAGLEWTRNDKMEGVVCRSVTTTLFDSKQAICVLEVQLGDDYAAGIGLPTTSRQATSTICKNSGAFGGVNAAFFDISNDPMTWWDYARVDGDDVVAANLLRNISGDPAINGAVVIKGGTNVSVRKLPSLTNQEAAKLSGDDIVVGGPVLMLKGVKEKISSSSHNNNRYARTAIGVTANRKLLLVTVDKVGTSAGMSNHEHAELMRLLGAYEAMSFDGGGSTTMYFKEWNISGIVNTPSGGAERNVVNTICVRAL